jgi:hypothetical protein
MRAWAAPSVSGEDLAVEGSMSQRGNARSSASQASSATLVSLSSWAREDILQSSRARATAVARVP